ncbi:MAG: ribosome small subunit-dependent GTPase A, partial [Gemmatimonadetes bacterium]|nr:ribosome small subunit-dependent GTPase A [Gemmatimonadota bacterium]
AVVLEDGSRVEASLRGRLKREQRTGSRVVVGDRVGLESQGDRWTIESVEPREAELVRRGRGGRAPKILAANLDRIFVTVAFEAPRASTQLIDRLLVLVESSGMHPTLILNKADLVDDPTTFIDLYESVGYEVIVASAHSGTGVDEIHRLACDGLSAFIGPSGAGKSSILNAIDPDLDLRTAGLSKKTGTGRHTTVGSRLIRLNCGGLVADTPGFGDVGLWSVSPEEVAECFPEFTEPAGSCRFRSCTHRVEPGCGVREALRKGEIPQPRYESYLALYEEADSGSGY